MGTLVLVAVGGALGAVARYGISGWVHAWAGTALPWGTFAVNAAGSFLLGFVVQWLEYAAVAPELRAALTVGFLGALTTFSTYSYETVALLRDRAWSRAGAYAFGSLAAGVAFVLLGFVAGRLLAHR